MKRTFCIIALLMVIALGVQAQMCDLDFNQPIGWCTCKSTKKAGYNVNGAEAVNKDYRKTIAGATLKDPLTTTK